MCGVDCSFKFYKVINILSVLIHDGLFQLLEAVRWSRVEVDVRY